MRGILHFLSLFGSFGTLFCCALPVLFVSLGMGATFASMTAAFPQIYWVAEHKTPIFIATGILLIISYVLMRRAKSIACPIDQGGAARQACQSAKPISQWIFRISVAMYVVGVLFSYVIPRIMYGQS